MKQANINRWAGKRGNYNYGKKMSDIINPDGGEFLAAENKLKSMIGSEKFHIWARNLPVEIVTNRSKFLDVVKDKIKEVNQCACHNCKTRKETEFAINVMETRIKLGVVTLPRLVKQEQADIEREKNRLSDLICSIHGKSK